MASAFRTICRRAKHTARNVLVIVENGFDLHHGIPSSYRNFRDYIAEHDAQLLKTMEEYFDSGFFWSDFEGTLAYLDTDMIADNAGNIQPTPTRPPTEYELEEMESADPRVLQGERSLASYLADTYKPTGQILRENKGFFDSLRSVDEIQVLGYSLSVFDWPNFRRVESATRGRFPLLKVSFYDSSKIQEYRQVLEEIGVPADSIRFARIADIYSPQLSLLEAAVLLMPISKSIK